MNEKYDPLAPHLPKDMTPEEAEAENQRLLRQQMEYEMFQETHGIKRRAAKITKLDD